jgi:serine/threonine protein kinase
MQDHTDSSTASEGPFERVLAEILKAEEVGHPLDLTSVVRSYPDLETLLREYFHNRDSFDRLAPHLAPTAATRGVPPEPQVLPACFGGYMVLHTLGQGGRGIVYRVRDPELNRPLAVKVLRSDLRDEPGAVLRFLEEAQVMGQLQHPGIVPVHGIGRLPDGRPYFAMKLVEGRTLAELLTKRPASAHDLPRFLVIFQQVCQAVAYAHSRGVIHRDLKPANVMVGAFGEVQVMDWGLAKVLTTDTAGQEPTRAETGPQASDLVCTVRTEATGLSTTDGTVVGTFAYMATEQAKGLVEELDRRVDVFGLGAILCEVLTGLPPYAGMPALDLHRMAAAGDLVEAFARLDTCGADVELVALARDCLATERERRPRDAGAVAERLATYLADVQERLRRAELKQAEEAAYKPPSACRLDHPREWAQVFYYLAAWRVICHGVMALLLPLGPAPAAYWAWFIGLHVGTWLPVWWLLRSERGLKPIERGALLNWGATFVCDALLFALFCPPWSQVRPDEVVRVYAAWPAAHGLWYVAEGRRSWGRFYVVGLGYFLAAPLLSLCALLAPVVYAPMAYALVVGCAMLFLGDSFRRLAAKQTAADALPSSSGDR